MRPDGKITFFPAGDLQAAGRTVEQLRDAVVEYRLRADQGRPYQLGIQDVIQIKVYGHQDLDTTQAIRARRRDIDPAEAGRSTLREGLSTNWRTR